MHDEETTETVSTTTYASRWRRVSLAVAAAGLLCIHSQSFMCTTGLLPVPSAQPAHPTRNPLCRACFPLPANSQSSASLHSLKRFKPYFPYSTGGSSLG